MHHRRAQLSDFRSRRLALEHRPGRRGTFSLGVLCRYPNGWVTGGGFPPPEPEARPSEKAPRRPCGAKRGTASAAEMKAALGLFRLTTPADSEAASSLEDDRARCIGPQQTAGAWRQFTFASRSRTLPAVRCNPTSPTRRPATERSLRRVGRRLSRHDLQKEAFEPAPIRSRVQPQRSAACFLARACFRFGWWKSAPSNPTGPGTDTAPRVKKCGDAWRRWCSASRRERKSLSRARGVLRTRFGVDRDLPLQLGCGRSTYGSLPVCILAESYVGTCRHR